MSATSSTFTHYGEGFDREAGLAVAGVSLDEIRTWPATTSVSQACRALGYSVSWGYELANSGEFPCRILTVRGRKRVITASLLELLSQTEAAGPA